MITLVDKGLSLSETKYLGHRRRLVSTGFGFGRKKEEGAESYPRFTTGFNTGSRSALFVGSGFRGHLVGIY